MQAPRNSFGQFRALVLADEALQRELRSLDNERDFIAHTVKLGKANGFDFTEDDVVNELRLARQEWLEAGIS